MIEIQLNHAAEIAQAGRVCINDGSFGFGALVSPRATEFLSVYLNPSAFAAQEAGYYMRLGLLTNLPVTSEEIWRGNCLASDATDILISHVITTSKSGFKILGVGSLICKHCMRV